MFKNPFLLLVSVLGALACARAPAPLEAATADETATAATPPATAAGAETHDAGAAGPVATSPAPPRERPYPPAAWRLARPELNGVVLWLSHILVRHDGVTDEVSFCQAGWRAQPPPSRPRSEALALARRIAAEARSQPERFTALAREHSEDGMTRERGGSLGGVTALHLASWPQVLDALAVVRQGSVSEVVETEYGFHVLYRNAPPPRERVSGAHIVIAHDQAPFLSQLQSQALPRRSREEALAVATEVHAAALKDSSRFGELARRHSEHPDAALAGDFGQWSTWEPTEYPRELEVLRSLEVGAIARPVETLFGWEILQRTPERVREVYAMTPIEIFGQVQAGSSGASGPAALAREPLALATELAQLLQREPQRFDEVQKQLCCGYVVQWPEGRGWPPLMALLQRLKPGEIAPEPIAFGLSYVIPKRVTPKPELPVQARFELPAPAEPDLGFVFTNLAAPILAAELATITENARVALLLPAEKAARLQQLHEACATPPDDPRQRQVAFDELQAKAQTLLGADTYTAYLRLMKEHFKEWLLRAS